MLTIFAVLVYPSSRRSVMSHSVIELYLQVPFGIFVSALLISDERDAGLISADPHLFPIGPAPRNAAAAAKGRPATSD